MLIQRLFLITLLATGITWAGVSDFSEGFLNFMRQRFGAESVPRLQILKRLIQDTRNQFSGNFNDQKPEGISLRRTNDFFNQVPYFSDQQVWGREDYWATPPEFLGRFAGDCEDYSIAKYMALKDMGIPIDRLRITYVFAKTANEAHMVLAYYPRPDAEPYILDNLNKEIRLASQRPDLEPVYSFNDEDLWTANGVTRKGGASQVRLWRDLQDKMLRESQM